MKSRRFVYSITFILLLCAAALLSGCGMRFGQDGNMQQENAGITGSGQGTDDYAALAPEDDEPGEMAPEDRVLHFLDPVIEAETRRILDKPAGDITEAEVLEITDFGVEQEYDDYSGLGKSGSVSGEITTLMDLQWFRNLKVLVLFDCDLDSLEGIEGLIELRVLYVRRNHLTSIEPVKELTHLEYLDC